MKSDVVKDAETVMRHLLRPRLDENGMPMRDEKGYKLCSQAVTTSQIRKFLTAVNMVTNKINVYKSTHMNESVLPEELVAEVQYLKVKIIYQAGKEDNRKPYVSNFMKASDMVRRIDKIKNSFEEYEEFARYVEALVAYHKFYGGRD